jgi:hypothetical protein
MKWRYILEKESLSKVITALAIYGISSIIMIYLLTKGIIMFKYLIWG